MTRPRLPVEFISFTSEMVPDLSPAAHDHLESLVTWMFTALPLFQSDPSFRLFTFRVDPQERRVGLARIANADMSRLVETWCALIAEEVVDLFQKPGPYWLVVYRDLYMKLTPRDQLSLRGELAAWLRQEQLPGYIYLKDWITLDE